MSKLRKVLGNFLICSNKNFLFLENFFLFFLAWNDGKLYLCSANLPQKTNCKKKI